MARRTMLEPECNGIAETGSSMNFCRAASMTPQIGSTAISEKHCGRRRAIERAAAGCS